MIHVSYALANSTEKINNSTASLPYPAACAPPLARCILRSFEVSHAQLILKWKKPTRTPRHRYRTGRRFPAGEKELSAPAFRGHFLVHSVDFGRRPGERAVVPSNRAPRVFLNRALGAAAETASGFSRSGDRVGGAGCCPCRLPRCWPFACSWRADARRSAAASCASSTGSGGSRTSPSCCRGQRGSACAGAVVAFRCISHRGSTYCCTCTGTGSRSGDARPRQQAAELVEVVQGGLSWKWRAGFLVT